MKGMMVLHHCDNPPCVNPDHLYLGTHRDNMDDVRERGILAGERGPRAKLNNFTVRLARLMYGNGGVSQQSLADYFGTAQSVMGYAIRGTTWSRIPAVEPDR